MIAFRATANEKVNAQPVNPISWRTVSDAKVVYVPLGEKPNKKGELKMTFARTGVRVEMADLSWWFFHFKSESWSRHYSIGGVERKDAGLTENQLQRKCFAPALYQSLLTGLDIAYTAEAEKRKN